MPIQPMGRDGLITHADAARILKVSERQLWRHVRRGYVFPAKLNKKHGPLYRQEEIYALLELRGKGISLPSVASMALQAQALSRTTDSRLRQLCELLGVADNRLKTDEDSVFHLHTRALRALNDNFSEYKSGAIVEWASIFNSFDEMYLKLLEDYTANSTPWDVYMELANKLMVNRSKEADGNLSFAYACLDVARKNLRHVSYFYAVMRHGYRLANEAFVKDEATEEVLQQLFPHIIDPGA